MQILEERLKIMILSEFGDLKGSAGLSVKYLSPFGGISINISTPLNSEAEDKTESFQFNLGTN